jgi:hypothetical protein
MFHKLDEIELIRSKGRNPFNNIIYGEYHFYEDEQKIEEKIIYFYRPSIIFSEVLGNYSIKSVKEADNILKNDYDRKFKRSQNGKDINYSLEYLCNWYVQYRIPIIGTGDLLDENNKIEDIITTQDRTLVLTGRSHIKVFYDFYEDVLVYTSTYNKGKHIKI